ncbi:MAG: four helix bundle protein [Candidatus Methylomirabilales bacterium]
MGIERFEDIKAWQEARALTGQVHDLTASPRFKTSHALKQQLERSTISIMANIAEGFDCQNDREFIRFLFYALRSTSEVQSHLYVALDRSLIDETQFEVVYDQCNSVKNLILGFIRYLKAEGIKGGHEVGLTTSDIGPRTSDRDDD